MELSSAQIDRGHFVLTDLICYPGAPSAADKGPSGAPDDLGQHHGAENRERALDQKARADDKETDDGGEAAAVHIGHDTSGHFEQQHGSLESGPYQNQLEGVQPHGGDVVDQVQGNHGGEEQTKAERGERMDVYGIELAQNPVPLTRLQPVSGGIERFFIMELPLRSPDAVAPSRRVGAGYLARMWRYGS